MQHYSTTQVCINGKRYWAILADSFIKKAIGLMFRQSLDKNKCMLFISECERNQSITMCNMLFPIDVMWLDSKQRVIQIEQNVKPSKWAIFKTYGPSKQSQYVLEFNAGFVKKNRISKESKIKLMKEKE
jgi:hypothetical protein